VISWFDKICFHKFNLYRYAKAAAETSAAAAAAATETLNLATAANAAASASAAAMDATSVAALLAENRELVAEAERSASKYEALEMAATVGGCTSRMQLTPIARKRLVTTLGSA
jgi:hypothetical protein